MAQFDGEEISRRADEINRNIKLNILAEAIDAWFEKQPPMPEKEKEYFNKIITESLERVLATPSPHQQRIASLEADLSTKENEIGGLTSELEQLRADYGRDASDHEVELGEAREVAELAADANSRLRKQLAELQEELEAMRLNKEFWYGEFESTRQQLAASQTEAAALRMAAEAFVVWSEDVWHEPWPEEITDFRKALAAFDGDS